MAEYDRVSMLALVGKVSERKHWAREQIAARTALREYVDELTLTDMDLSFLLSGEYGARNCPCQHCGALSAKLDRILKSPRRASMKESPDV